MDTDIDLFEHYETLPQEVQDIIGSWDEMAEHGKYNESDRIMVILVNMVFVVNHKAYRKYHNVILVIGLT